MFLALRPVILLKKRLWHRYSPVNFAKFLKIPFSQNTSGRLLLFLWILRNVSKELFSGKRVKSCFGISTVNYAGHKAYFKKIYSYFTILLQSEILFKNIKKSWVYSIKLSGLWYSFKSLPGYFSMKRKWAKKLTWMIVLKLKVGKYLRWSFFSKVTK